MIVASGGGTEVKLEYRQYFHMNTPGGDVVEHRLSLCSSRSSSPHVMKKLQKLRDTEYHIVV